MLVSYFIWSGTLALVSSSVLLFHLTTPYHITNITHNYHTDTDIISTLFCNYRDMMDIDFDMTDFDTYRMPLFRRMLGWRLPPDPNSENNNGDTIPTKRQEMSPKQRLESLEEEL